MGGSLVPACIIMSSVNMAVEVFVILFAMCSSGCRTGFAGMNEETDKEAKESLENNLAMWTLWKLNFCHIFMACYAASEWYIWAQSGKNADTDAARDLANKVACARLKQGPFLFLFAANYAGNAFLELK